MRKFPHVNVYVRIFTHLNGDGGLSFFPTCRDCRLGEAVARGRVILDRLRMVAVAVAVWVAGCGPGYSEASEEQLAAYIIASSACKVLKDDKARLDCFDKAVAALSSEQSGTATATTKDMLATFGPADFKTADPDDIHVSPRKFTGKPIEVKNLRCFYADRDDYRCIAGSSLVTAFFVQKVSPPEERERLESDCGSIKAVGSPKCRRTIRIVPTDFEKDSVNGLTERIIVKATSLDLLQPAAPTKRRR